MINFWVSFFFLLISWGFAVAVEGLTLQMIGVSVLFFALYFISPIVKRRGMQLIYIALPLLLAWTFASSELNGFVWLLYLALALQSTAAFAEWKINVYVGFLYVLMVFPFVFSQMWLTAGYITLLALMTGVLLAFLRRATDRKQELQEQYEAVYNEYRRLKRQLATGEEMARQEERNQIAREIHDSVGHRLTALLMQMEVARIQAGDEEMKNKFSELKKLAQASLDDTREAVKTLKSEETAGIQAVIQLIRKLESESQLRLSITVQTGVLGTVLSNQQSVVIYRSLQEALTNMMRHSISREADIEFQIVAQRDLRFQVSHPLKEKVQIEEGFGLKSMRERLADIDGRLTIQQSEGRLYVIGQFPLEERRHG